MEWSSNKIVSVVIVTCSKKDYLKSCLNSLKNQAYSVFKTKPDKRIPFKFKISEIRFSKKKIN